MDKARERREGKTAGTAARNRPGERGAGAGAAPPPEESALVAGARQGLVFRI